MPSRFDPQKHHRRSIRLPNYDYSQSGAYYITIVTYQRALLFGQVVNQEIQLSELGKIVDECWRAISDHFLAVELGAYVVMPNHIHSIIVIRADVDAPARRGTIYRAPTEQFQKLVQYRQSSAHIKRPSRAVLDGNLMPLVSGSAIITNISFAMNRIYRTKRII